METFASSSRSKHKTLTVIIIIALLALVAALEIKRRAVEEQLQQLTVRLEQVQVGNSQQNQEAAKKVVVQLKKHMVIDESVEPTVATIVDIKTLRERNPFYNKAENGDYLVVTPDRAILFSAKKDRILDVVPVQLQPVAAEGSSKAATSSKTK